MIDSNIIINKENSMNIIIFFYLLLNENWYNSLNANLKFKNALKNELYI